MLTDKDIANEVLEMIKHEIEDFTKAAMESSNNLRQTLLQIRNQCEQDQTALGQYAIHQQWYLPAAPANPVEVQNVANFFSPSVNNPMFR